MKRIIVVALSLMAGLSIWIAKYANAGEGNFSKSAPIEERSRFEKSDWGTLTVVRDKNGNEIFGEGKPTNEGFSVAYQVLDNFTGKPKKGEAEKQVYFNRRYPIDLTYCPTCQRRNNINQAVSTAITKDGTLMITSSFEFDPKTELLTVYRRIRNISNEPEVSKRNVDVNLVSIQVQYEPQLASNKPSYVGLIGASKKQATSQSNRANNFASQLSFLSPATLLVPCEYCPPADCTNLTLTLGESEEGIICVDCPGDADPVRTRVQLNVPGASCKHPIKIVEWNSVISGGGGLSAGVRPGEDKFVCVHCPKLASDVVTVESFPAFGTTAANIANTHSCTAVVRVKRKEDKFAQLHRTYDTKKPVTLPAEYGSYYAMGLFQNSGKKNDPPRNEPKSGNLPEQPLKPGQEVAFWVVYSLKR